jgi:hypothetical protein
VVTKKVWDAMKESGAEPLGGGFAILENPVSVECLSNALLAEYKTNPTLYRSAKPHDGLFDFFA